MLEEAEDDLQNIGLELDTLKVQDVSDDVGYLDSIGRRQSAEVRKNARIAEAISEAEAAVRNAQNRQQTRVSELQARLETLKAESAKRIADAQTRRAAVIAEAEGEVRAQLARVKAEVEVEAARVEMVRRQLQADKLEPAEARKSAAEAEAKGQAAKIVENGRASARAMAEIADSWKDMGPGAKEVFLMQKVDDLMGIVMSSVGDLKVDRLTVLGGAGAQGSGGNDAKTAVGAAGLSGLLNDKALAGNLLALREQVEAATGVDLLKSLKPQT